MGAVGEAGANGTNARAGWIRESVSALHNAHVERARMLKSVLGLGAILKLAKVVKLLTGSQSGQMLCQKSIWQYLVF